MDLARFLKGCDFAGFNLSRFDLPLLKKELDRARAPFETEGRHVIDAQAIFHMRERRDLKAAVKFYGGVAHKKAHSALDDAGATCRLPPPHFQTRQGVMFRGVHSDISHSDGIIGLSLAL